MSILGRLAILALVMITCVATVGAQSTWHRERATWLQQNTAAATNGTLGLTEPGWRADCRLVLSSPRASEQRARVYDLSAVQRVEPDPVDDRLVHITFDSQAPLGRVQLQAVIETRARVIEQILAYASACGAPLPSSGS